MPYFVPEIQRKKLIILIFTFLLLEGSKHHPLNNQVEAMAPDTVHFKLRHAEQSARPQKEDLFPGWTDEKIHKHPSGPNPIGNHHPPTKQ
ncbi:CLAVATA3/ESR (CLE)-related protein 46-like isoform X2 [Tripterygium wilfordii]|uniref:CLAVATA3/ESR (CLE)-related protein 46-like isoform X2 n=1 Tax=Tripterygium wilfordii TaxID=458696 RepID=UPI0018F7FE23|nr:CLAVATA3/ESR (CLE)-related protein 46-like isoform X2 [Tripterygium wilfordii]